MIAADLVATGNDFTGICSLEPEACSA